MILQEADATGFSGVGTVNFAGIDMVSGSNGLVDALTDSTGASLVDWTLDSTLTYSDGTHTLGLTAIENLAGGSGADTFTITGVHAANLLGGAGADTFRFNDGAALTGTIDGGADTDTLDESMMTTARQVMLTGLGAVDGFAGMEAAVTNGFTNLDVLAGGTAVDTLTGLNAAATWEIDGTNCYLSTNTLNFTNFDNLTGGSGEDLFLVSTTLAGLLRGGAGDDKLDFSIFPAPLNIVLEGADASGFGGTGAVAFAFAGIDIILGSANARDSLTAAAGGFSTSTWTLDADPTFSDGTHSLSFSRIEDLTGTSNVSLAFGLIADTTALDLTLRYDSGTGTIQLFDSATLALVSSAIVIPAEDNLLKVIGTAGANQLRIDASVPNAQLAVVFDAMAGEDTLDLGGFLTPPGRSPTANLTGGDGTDTFTFNDGASLSGTIDGGTGTDSLDYSAYNTAQQITLTNLGSSDGFTGTATGISGGFANVDDLVGGTGSDTLTGLDADGTWTLNATSQYQSTNTLEFTGFENLAGESGSGRALGSECGGRLAAGQYQRVSEQQQAAELCGVRRLGGGAGTDVFNIVGPLAGNLFGEAGADEFVFAAEAMLTGAIDGGADTDQLDLAALGTAQQVYLTGLGGVDGFAGAQTIISGGFTNLNAITAGAGSDDALRGLDNDAAWHLDTVDSYVSSSLLNFAGFDTLIGGIAQDIFSITGSRTANLSGQAGADMFLFADGAVLTGAIDGGADADWLDLTGLATPVNIGLGAPGALMDSSDPQQRSAMGLSTWTLLRRGRVTGIP